MTVKDDKQLGDGALRFDISGDHLVLTIGPESLHVCRHCPNLHVVILPNVSADNMRNLVLGMAQLASHLHDD